MIEHADFLESIAPKVKLNREQEIRIAKTVRDIMLWSAADFPSRAEYFNAKADEYQLQIDNLSMDVPSSWIEEAETDKWDFTPFPKEMPDIDFDTVDEISF